MKLWVGTLDLSAYVFRRQLDSPYSIEPSLSFDMLSIRPSDTVRLSLHYLSKSISRKAPVSLYFESNKETHYTLIEKLSYQGQSLHCRKYQKPLSGFVNFPPQVVEGWNRRLAETNEAITNLFRGAYMRDRPSYIYGIPVNEVERLAAASGQSTEDVEEGINDIYSFGIDLAVTGGDLSLPTIIEEIPDDSD